MKRRAKEVLRYLEVNDQAANVNTTACHRACPVSNAGTRQRCQCANSNRVIGSESYTGNSLAAGQTTREVRCSIITQRFIKARRLAARLSKQRTKLLTERHVSQAPEHGRQNADAAVAELQPVRRAGTAGGKQYAFL
jgi:hypothetical protein